jgi:hypothetical protein
VLKKMILTMNLMIKRTRKDEDVDDDLVSLKVVHDCNDEYDDESFILYYGSTTCNQCQKCCQTLSYFYFDDSLKAAKQRQDSQVSDAHGTITRFLYQTLCCQSHIYTFSAI